MGFPFVPQHDSTDCGAACLVMVARYFGKETSIASIRELAYTDNTGTTFQGLVWAAHSLGLTSKGVKGNPEHIQKGFPLPCIAHTYQADLNQFHFVVVYKISRKYISIADPAKGKRLYRKKEFFQTWTGGILIFSIDVTRTANSRKTMGPLLRFLPLLRPYTFLFIQVLIISVLLFWCAIAQFFYFRYLVDVIIPSGMKSTLGFLSFGMFGITVLHILMGSLREYILNHVGCRIDLGILLTYLGHVLHLPMGFFDKRRVGEILTRMDDARQIRSLVSGTALSSIMDICMVVGVGTFLFFQTPILASLALATVPLSVMVVLIFQPLFKHHTKKTMVLNAISHSHMVETLSGIFTIKALNHENRSFWIGEQKLLQAIQGNFTLGNLAIWQNLWVSLIEGVGRILILWQGAVLILRGELSLGQLISFQALVGYFVGPLKSLLTLQPALQGAQSAAKRMTEILDLAPEHCPEKNILTTAGISPPVVCKNLEFRYNPKRSSLDGINFSFQEGQRIGIVGPSGSGKSTLIKLLLGFYQPTSGSITFKGVDTRDLAPTLIRKHIGYIPQEVRLFSGTLHDNLVMYNPDCSVADLFDACIKAQLLEFITSLPDRFQTWVGEQGTSLSGGERQRIAIARALLGRPKILLFDEATSALDSVTEAKIQQTIDGLSNLGITILLVAHRLSSITRCDKILILEKGQICEEGNHQELLNRKGLYYKLWTEQRVEV